VPCRKTWRCSTTSSAPTCYRSRLIGRWQTEADRVVAVWEYDDRQAYERIQAAVRADPATRQAQQVRRSLPALITATDETFMSSTLG
jgi:NIPSNAP